MKTKKLIIAVIIIILILIIIPLIIEYKSKIPIPPLCYSGEKKCDGENILSCYDNKAWNVIDICEYGCVYGSCLGDIPQKPICGDGKCEIGEQCSIDCGIEEFAICDNGRCEVSTKIDEFLSCPQDCGIICGDGECVINPYDERVHCPQDCGSGIPQEDIEFSFSRYNIARKNAGISNVYVSTTNHYDYSNPIIKNLLPQLKKYTVEKTVKAVAKWTFDNIEYDTTTLSGSLIKECMETKASEIIKRRFGLCSTQSKVNIALLRGMGIASRLVGGCTKPSISCRTLSITGIKKFPPLNWVEENGRAVYLGYAHAWVEVWLPNKGWVMIESTSGRVYTSHCLKYDAYYREPSSAMIDMCGLDMDDAERCKGW